MDPPLEKSDKKEKQSLTPQEERPRKKGLFKKLANLSERGSQFVNNVIPNAMSSTDNRLSNERKKEVKDGRKQLLRLAAQQENTRKLIEKNLGKVELEALDLPDLESLTNKILNKEGISSSEAREFIEGIQRTSEAIESVEDRLTVTTSELTEGVINLIDKEGDGVELRHSLESFTDIIQRNGVELNENQQKSFDLIKEGLDSTEDFNADTLENLREALTDLRDDTTSLKTLDNLRDLNRINEKIFLSNEDVKETLETQGSLGTLMEDFLENAGDFTSNLDNLDLFGSLLGLGPIGQAFSGLTPVLLGVGLIFGKVVKLAKALARGITKLPGLFLKLGERILKLIDFFKKIPAKFSKLLGKIPGVAKAVSSASKFTNKGTSKIQEVANKVAGKVGALASKTPEIVSKVGEVASKVASKAPEVVSQASEAVTKAGSKGLAKVGIKGVLQTGRFVPLLGNAISAGFAIKSAINVGYKVAKGEPLTVKDLSLLALDTAAVFDPSGLSAGAAIGAEFIPEGKIIPGTDFLGGRKEIQPGATDANSSEVKLIPVPISSGGQNSSGPKVKGSSAASLNRSISIDDFATTAMNLGG